jgi:uncharacterized protein (TIGR02145 family)
MELRKIFGILCCFLIGISFFCCKTEEIILHGDLKGTVTDAATSQPLQNVNVKLENDDDSIITGNDGKYLFKSLTPGNYEIRTSKYGYSSVGKTTTVVSAKTQEIDFALNLVPVPDFSVQFLDFGLDSTIQSFRISNKGVGEMAYVITPGQKWITVDPSVGTISDESDTIYVQVSRTGLSEKIYRENIKIISLVGEQVVQNNIDILVNGVMDSDSNYYGTVTIGTQRWLKENLNTGIVNESQTDNGIIEKFCNLTVFDCKTFGGLYYWDESMKYNPPDNNAIGKTQGICPVGWHIPTREEWLTLIDFLGGADIAGGKLKSSEYWSSPNTAATNETGFTALPAGRFQNTSTGLWSSSEFSFSSSNILRLDLFYNSAKVRLTEVTLESLGTNNGFVRCTQDPPKN